MNGSERSGSFIDQFPGTAAFIMINTAFFVLEVLVHRKHPDVAINPERYSLLWNLHADVYLALGSSEVRRVVDGELWRVLACTFLHGGILHLAMNMYVLLALGRTCEPLLGTQRFVATYLACGLLSSLTAIGYRYLTLAGIELMRSVGSVGASGALAGLIGLLLGYSIRHKDKALRSQIVQSIIFIAVITIFVIPQVDHAGHIGGLVAGTAFGWFVPRYTSSRSLSRWRIPCWILCILAAISLGFAVWNNLQTEFQ